MGKVVHTADGKEIHFDMRMEMGLGIKLMTQVSTLVINEIVVRLFYFIERFMRLLKDKKVSSFKDIKYDMVKECLPFKNRTVTRMLTISLGVMNAADLFYAAITSKGSYLKFFIY